MPTSKASARSSQIASHLVMGGSSSSRSASTVASSQAASFSPAVPAPGLPQPHTGGGANLDEPKVLVSTNNGVFEIILNREKAINALDTDMVKGITGAIDQASRGRNHSVVVLRAIDSSRGLCSGGDVLKVVNMANSESEAERQGALEFFRQEFELDWRIAKLGEQVAEGSDSSVRPFVSYMDGITMGGGVGLSVHAPFRVATEKTLFAMPETGIGYFPDVGVTRVLSRLDGRVGAYLGLTGERMSGEEAYLAGLATHFVPSSALSRLTDALAALPAGANGKQVASAIEDFTVDPFGTDNVKGASIVEKTPLLGDLRVALDYAFGQPSVESLFAVLTELSLKGQDLASSQSAQELQKIFGVDVTKSAAISTWAAKTLATLNDKSPRSLKVSLQAINNEARHLDVDESFRFDMRLATAFCDMSIGKDFYEGVHHVLTKDPSTGKRREGRAPWQPARVEEVAESDVKSLFFAPIAEAQQAGLQAKLPELTVIPVPSGKDSRSRDQRRARIRGLGPAGWEPTFNYFHPLPSEAELEALLQGSHPASGSFQLDLASEEGKEAVNEIVNTLSSWRSSRGLGESTEFAWALERKVLDWVKRRRSDTSKKGSVK